MRYCKLWKDDPYTATETISISSMLVSSAIIGLIGIAISYLIAVPLRSYMARFKNTWIDSSLTGLLTFLLALPTIALVYIRLGGSSVGLPDSSQFLVREIGVRTFFQQLFWDFGCTKHSYLDPCYMIDLQSQDFVRFAGLRII